MSRHNLTLLFMFLSVVLASCQSVQEPKEITVKPVDVKPIKKTEPKVDEGLKIVNHAIEQIKNNNIELAQSTLEGYLKKNNDNRAKINLALIHMKKNEFQKAKMLFLSVQQIDESNITALEHLAIIARQEGQFKDAKDLYIKALGIGDKPSIHLNYAILLDLYLNELEQALEHYEIYQSTGLAEKDGIELEKWIADLKVRLKRLNE